MGILEALRAVVRVREEESHPRWHAACDRLARELIYTRTFNRERTYWESEYGRLIGRKSKHLDGTGGRCGCGHHMKMHNEAGACWVCACTKAHEEVSA